MKKLFYFILGLSLVVVFNSCKSKQAKTNAVVQKKEIVSEHDNKEAINSAKEWLAIMDQQKYAESWDSAATLFKSAILKEKWIETLNGSVSSFGKATQRELISAKYYTELPGVPDGEYVVIQFKTNFENKENSIETITPMKDGNVWRVSGYFIK